MVVLTVKLVALTLSVTWGLTKTILFGVGLPVILAVLFIAGLTAFAVPLLILALLGRCSASEEAAAAECMGRGSAFVLILYKRAIDFIK